MVDLWSDAGFIECRCGYSLRRDHQLRSFAVKVEATTTMSILTLPSVSPASVFDEIEEQIWHC
jgi:hypothetical protein